MKNQINIYKFLTCIILIVSGTIGDAKGENKVSEIKWEGSSNSFKLFSAQNEDKIPEYYYADVIADDEGKTKVRVYWDIWGDYLKFGLKDGDHLTKLNGEPFSIKDMEKLHLLLNNKDADIKHYKMSDLSSKEAENKYYSLDAVSGATVVESSYECVDGAIKICYNLWNQVHGDAANAIKSYTLESLESRSSVLQQKDKDLFYLVDKIRHEQKIGTTDLNRFNELSNHSLIWYSTLIYELKLSGILDKNINTRLNTLLLNDKTQMNKLLVFNFLMDSDFHSKEVRQFEIDYKVL